MTFIEFIVFEKILGIVFLKFFFIGIFKVYEEFRLVILLSYLKKFLNGIKWLDYLVYLLVLVLDYFFMFLDFKYIFKRWKI